MMALLLLLAIVSHVAQDQELNSLYQPCNCPIKLSKILFTKVFFFSKMACWKESRKVKLPHIFLVSFVFCSFIFRRRRLNVRCCRFPPARVFKKNVSLYFLVSAQTVIQHEMSKQAFKNFIYINNCFSIFSGFNENLKTPENEGTAAWQWSQLIRTVGETTLFPPTVVFMSGEGFRGATRKERWLQSAHGQEARAISYLFEHYHIQQSVMPITCNFHSAEVEFEGKGRLRLRWNGWETDEEEERWDSRGENR